MMIAMLAIYTYRYFSHGLQLVVAFGFIFQLSRHWFHVGER